MHLLVFKYITTVDSERSWLGDVHEIANKHFKSQVHTKFLYYANMSKGTCFIHSHGLRNILHEFTSNSQCKSLCKCSWWSRDISWLLYPEIANKFSNQINHSKILILIIDIHMVCFINSGGFICCIKRFEECLNKIYALISVRISH